MLHGLWGVTFFILSGREMKHLCHFFPSWPCLPSPTLRLSLLFLSSFPGLFSSSMDHSSKPSFPTPFSPLFVLKHLLRGPIPLLSTLSPQTLDSLSAVQGAASRKLWRRWTQTSMEVYAKQECPSQRRSWTLTGIPAE